MTHFTLFFSEASFYTHLSGSRFCNFRLVTLLSLCTPAPVCEILATTSRQAQRTNVHNTTAAGHFCSSSTYPSLGCGSPTGKETGSQKGSCGSSRAHDRCTAWHRRASHRKRAREPVAPVLLFTSWRGQAPVRVKDLARSSGRSPGGGLTPGSPENRSRSGCGWAGSRAWQLPGRCLPASAAYLPLFYPALASQGMGHAEFARLLW